MAQLAITCLLVAAVLTAIAIFVQVNASALSLPVSMGTTILTILLPLIAAANFFYSPILHRAIQQSGSLLLQQLVLPGLQILQGILTVVLVTLSSQGLAPNQGLRCGLEENWQRLWSSHDGRGIERVQDAFSCCGLNTIKDRAWPPGQCSQMYERHTPCAGPWRAAMQRDSGLEFAVAATVGILQLVQLVFFRLGGLGRRNATRYKRIAQSEGAVQDEGLLEESDGSDEGEGDGANRPRLGYGSIDNGNTPRVEPSHLGEERNHWGS